MEGGSVNSVECQRANIDGGKAESLSIESDGSISNGTIDTIWMYSACEDGLHGGILSIYGGTFLKHPITYKSVIMDYTGRASELIMSPMMRFTCTKKGKYGTV